jgi:hypothetical protein
MSDDEEEGKGSDYQGMSEGDTDDGAIAEYEDEDAVTGAVMATATTPKKAAEESPQKPKRGGTDYAQPFNANEDECRGGDFVFGLPPLWIPKGVTTALSARSAKARGIFEHIRMANAGGG